jgi:PTH1 family peptidyl-tRNA hydrolase
MSRKTILVGLGNPDERYHCTRHNVGFMVLDHLAGKYKARWSRSRTGYHLANISLARAQLLMIKPQTYVNLSGDALRDLGEREEYAAGDLLVICDDFNLPLGSLRLRGSGGDGGHNGLLSIIEFLGTTGFARLRLGIGPLPPDLDPADFVLDPFGEEELDTLGKAVRLAGKCVQTFMESGIERAMARFNLRPSAPESD